MKDVNTLQSSPQKQSPNSLSFEKIIKDLRKYGTWGKNGKDQVEELKLKVQENFPEKLVEFNTISDKAKRAGEIADTFYKLGTGGINSKVAEKICNDKQLDRTKTKIEELLKIQEEAICDLGFKEILFKAKNNYTNGVKAAQRFHKGRQLSQNGKKRTTVKPRGKKTAKTISMLKHPLVNRRELLPPPDGLHANDIRTLTPHSSWTLLLDETGDDFFESAQSRSNKKRELGRMIGLLLPEKRHGLNALPSKWHAVEVDDPSEIDTVLQAILDADCGVFGLSVKSLPVTPGERWAQLAQAVIEWILLLLPIEGKTQINVLIEQRGQYERNQNWNLMADIIKRFLASTWPERAKVIDLKIRTIDKSGHSHNGYVDALAFTWAQSTPWSQNRLQDSRLSGTCLISVDAHLLLQNWNAFSLGQNIDGETWSKLLTNPDARSQESLTSTLLDAIGRECKESPQLWDRYLRYCSSHLVSKAVNLPKLASQIEWLERFLPAGEILPFPLRLAWLTVKLANANHHGETESSWLQELNEIAEKLLIEDAPLVCQADLHRAVQATNRFAFTEASASLKRWLNSDPAVPGLRFWAQVQSSLGQHAAFTDEPDEAMKYFNEALKGFSQLSDGGIADCSQTGTYKAIAMIDDIATDTVSVRKALENILGNLEESAIKFGKSNDARHKYGHHLFLRYLIFRGDKMLQELYLSEYDNWQSSIGHPWPLIEAYRAMLLHPNNKQDALETMLDGAALAFEAKQGPTVQLIGSCLRAIAHTWGEQWDNYEEVITTLRESLPHASKRIDILQAYLDNPSNEREMLAHVLPFSFR